MKTALIVVMVLFSLLSIGIVVLKLVQHDYKYVMRGVWFPLLLLIPSVFKWLGLKPTYKMYIMAYVFIMFAYNWGILYGGFSTPNITDKVSHFLSGFIFTIAGFCLYYWMAGPKPGGLRQDWLISSSFALFFSMFVACVWEVIEFCDFNFSGNDAQQHLTTGVYDTMWDMINCLAGSVICVAAFILYRFKGVKLMTAHVVEEFYDVNVEGRGPMGKKAAE